MQKSKKIYILKDYFQIILEKQEGKNTKIYLYNLPDY